MIEFNDKFDSARPYTACFVILRREGKIAMVLRKNTGYMDGYYGLPAGKVEYHETYRQGAIRESLEESGVKVGEDKLEFVHTVHRHSNEDDKFMDWVDVYFEALEWDGEPYNAEVEKSERLDWIDLGDSEMKIVEHQKDALLKIENGKRYSEYGWK